MKVWILIVRTCLRMLWVAPLITVMLLTAKPVGAAWGGSEFSLTVNVSPENGGTVKIGNTIPDAYPSTQKLPANQTIELTAKPRDGYRFTGWSGDSAVEAETISVTMTCPKNLYANFAPIKYRLLTIVSPVDGGEIILKPPQPQDGYEFGTEVTITVRPAQGFAFKEWTGTDLSTTGNSASYMATSSKSITAVFVEKSSNMWGWVWGGVGVIVVGVLLYIFAFKKR